MERFLLLIVICVTVCGCAVEKKFSPAETNARMKNIDYYPSGVINMENRTTQYIWSNDYGDDITLTIGGVGTTEEFLMGCEVTDHHMFYQVCNRQEPVVFVYGEDNEETGSGSLIGNIAFTSAVVVALILLGAFAL